jgi:hypothetical protein
VPGSLLTVLKKVLLTVPGSLLTVLKKVLLTVPGSLLTVLNLQLGLESVGVLRAWLASSRVRNIFAYYVGAGVGREKSVRRS